LSISLENLRRDLRARLETDSQMSGAWVIVPLLPLIIGGVAVASFIAILFSLATSGTTTATTSLALASFVGLLSLFYLGYFLLIILVAIMIFRLVKRRNLHFNRQILLYEDLVSVTKELASRKNIDVSILVNNMDRNLREARFEELEKNATLWSLLSFTGFGLWYAAYFLMRDFYRHERREDQFVQDLLRTFYALGIPVNLPYRSSPIPERSFALYFVLTLITASIFSVYWVYVLVSDPNNHFRQQMVIEDAIMAQANPALSATPPPPPPPVAKT
jgi:hypothetical protein